ncbi:hypothetical protein TOPB45_0810 [Thermodesulfobacterium geofontis OPF15]|uniref:Uncharacterized protein n=2 Tax=Thermodesulfobacterium geofontis TaxID=1295609 RepID=F8C5D8_THEGP|nr:hypothetical protein TOPB45_0810 [Thermodesulfobacterium geofontis OPF15]
MPITIAVKYRKIEKPKQSTPTPEVEKRWEELEKKSCWYIGFKKEIYICKEGGECRTLQPDKYKYDKEKCELEVTLAPGESIKVAEICCSYTGPEKRFADKLNVEELNINTPGGLIKYEGFELLKIFKKKDKTKYVLEYS